MKQYESDLDVLLETIKLKKKTVVDIGCGDGSKAKQLVEHGATVIGIEPNLEFWQVSAYEDDGFKILAGSAEKLNLEDNSADVVVFMYSLHHVPAESMEAAILDVHRVLKHNGVLYIAEPIAKGSYQEVCESFIDETIIREHAKAAVEKYAKPKFDRCDEFEYCVFENFENFDQFVDEMMRYALDRYELDNVANIKVKERFEKTQDGSHYRLAQPVMVWVLYNADQS